MENRCFVINSVPTTEGNRGRPLVPETTGRKEYGPLSLCRLQVVLKLFRTELALLRMGPLHVLRNSLNKCLKFPPRKWSTSLKKSLVLMSGDHEKPTAHPRVPGRGPPNGLRRTRPSTSRERLVKRRAARVSRTFPTPTWLTTVGRFGSPRGFSSSRRFVTSSWLRWTRFVSVCLSLSLFLSSSVLLFCNSLLFGLVLSFFFPFSPTIVKFTFLISFPVVGGRGGGKIVLLSLLLLFCFREFGLVRGGKDRLPRPQVSPLEDVWDTSVTLRHTRLEVLG